MDSTDALANARHAVRELAEVVWPEVPPTGLPGAAAELARMRSQVDAALIAVAGRLVETDAAAGEGWASAKDFLTHVTGGRKGAGGALVRAAAETAELPRVHAALRAGEVSLAQARVVGARVAALPRDPEFRSRVADRLLALATEQSYDATDLDRAFANAVEECDPDRRVRGEERERDLTERGAHQARHLSFAEDAFGGVRIRGYATIEDAEAVKTTLMPLAAPVTTEAGACGGDPDRRGPRRGPDGLRTHEGSCPDPACGHDGRDPREHGTRIWDALVEACRRLQADDALPHAHGTTARVTVTIDHDDLAGRLEARGLLPGGGSLSVAAVRRLACDAEILPAVLGSDGQVLDVGRLQRLVTTSLWLALVLRDRHCAFPGCTRLPIACDAHHVVHWAEGGPTSLDNLLLLCHRHHTITHQTPWTVVIDPATRRPVWTPPAVVDDRDRIRYRPAVRPPPAA